MKVATFCLMLSPLALAQQTSEQEHKNDFMSFDSDGNGLIDASEVRMQFPQISAEDLSAFFIATDKNEDGLITFKEYMDASLSHESGGLDLNSYKVF